MPPKTPSTPYKDDLLTFFMDKTLQVIKQTINKVEKLMLRASRELTFERE
jgi:hypothetical protein